jgi:uncharacterized damage-inducible protein DinB
MSVFTNPAGRSIENARAYVSAVLELLGDRQPFDVLGATPSALGDALDDLSPAQLATPEAPGKWAVRDVVQHLVDSELVWAYRMRLVLAEDRPPLTGYDQDRWADRLHYAESHPREALDEFRVLRRANLRLLERATPADLERVGVHGERGEESLAHMIRLYAGHDLLHLRQIKRIAEAV